MSSIVNARGIIERCSENTWQWVEKTEDSYSEEYFCDLIPDANDMNRFRVHTQFYDGGTCVDEMVEEELNKLFGNESQRIVYID